ncbi:hypothetical protein Sru01_08960 [Sphaerisporangium rufum]|uniref:Uncharacterized protein n=1 Tax=Sphaerisporangium rufum TaxID=1381558 RepID=A0A919UXJ6_9ACTN|nr:hypothetical protein [Sphaerisporangium rufum]GII75914.1 hypothetical protein Sru01_08960 [Sphaerisporangium rufum]
MITGGVAVIGEPVRLAGPALAGAVVLPAADEAGVRAAWHALPDGIAVVILTAWAARTLGPVTGRLTVVMPAGPGEGADAGRRGSGGAGPAGDAGPGELGGAGPGAAGER